MRKIRDQTQLSYLSSLASLLGSGIGIMDALEGARESVGSRDKRLCARLIILEKTVKSGGEIHMAFLNAGFHQEIVYLVELGNSSGVLGETIQRGATRLAQKIEMRRKIVGATLYPSVVLALTVGIVGFLTFYVFPKIIPLFQGRESSLPIITRSLIWITHTVSAYWWVIAAIILALGFSIWLTCRTKKGRMALWSVFSATPFLGRLLEYRRCSAFFGTLGTLLSHGSQLRDSVALAGRVAGGEVLHERASQMDEFISKGGLLSAFAKKLKIFPDFAPLIISVGERSGTLPESCLTVEREADRRATSLMDRMTDMVEPLLMVAMGGSVGSIALAIIMPIYEITRGLQHQ